MSRPDDRRTLGQPRAALVARLRLVGSGLAVGVPAGPVGVGLLWVAGRSTPDAVTTVFAVGTVVLGIGVLGWAGSVFAGRGIEAAQRHMNTATDWTERDSRRAMTRVTGAGLGVSISSSIIDILVRLYL